MSKGSAGHEVVIARSCGHANALINLSGMPLDLSSVRMCVCVRPMCFRVRVRACACAWAWACACACGVGVCVCAWVCVCVCSCPSVRACVRVAANIQFSEACVSLVVLYEL